MAKSLWMEDAVTLHELFVAGEVRATDIVEHHLERLNARDPVIRAFLHVAAEQARAQAAVQDRWSPAERAERPLSGVPVAIKDNIVTETMPTTAASRILQNFYAPYNATVVDKLYEAGAIVIGKTNLDEFAMGSSTEHSAFYPTRNPWALDRVPGGSSGGSAAAVAAGMVPLALGSDTGGSIRQPSAYCGIIGMKPTYGRVSRYGLIAFASSLDQIGPMARRVRDLRALYDVIAGPDPRDATSLPDTTDATPLSRPWRIGVPREYFGEGLDPEIRHVLDRHLSQLRAEGHEIRDISLPHTRFAIAAYYLIAPAEASSNLSRYDGIRYGFRRESRDLVTLYEATRDEGFGPEVKRRILLGTHALSSGYYDAYYLTAQKVRTLIRRDFDDAFHTVDFVVTPTTPEVAFRLGERSDDPLTMYLGDIYTVTANLAGLPAISLPVGWAHGLPVGVQWLAKPLADHQLLEAAEALEGLLPPVRFPEEVEG
ncbi:MAG: Asp-tRNA(Asn)/Glu-tRNA(Gln) amidotransferase subunit GatA [Firmicutes bacterium]|nr:Asp-tRNA(Asn)/Glu-tRNA(Gln) amidotransferase subunit GatA [Bacillota bacterium]